MKLNLKPRLLGLTRRLYRELFARPIFFRANQYLMRLGMTGVGILNYENDRVSGENVFLKTFGASHTKPTVIDVGANVGSYSKKVLCYAPSATIYAFEPHPLTFRKLQQEAEEHAFEAMKMGCGDQSRVLPLFDYASRDGSAHASLHSGVLRELHNANELTVHEVQIIPLDQFIEQRSLGQIDLLKIDTEGNELNVLRGAEQAIKAGKIATIHFEFNEMNVESRVFFKDIADFLSNYEFFRMLPSGLAPMGDYRAATWEIFAYQNIVARLRKR